MRLLVAAAVRRAAFLALAATASWSFVGCSLGLDEIGGVLDSEGGTDDSSATDETASAASGSDDSGDAGAGDEATALDDGAVQDDATAAVMPADGPPSASEGSLSTAPGDGTVAGAADATAVQNGLATPDSGGPGAAGGAACANDGDCPQDFAHCRASLCSGGVCSAPADYHLLASQFAVAGVPAKFKTSGSHPSAAIAVAYPFVFVVTSSVSAFDVTSPLATTPRAVKLDGLDPAVPYVGAVAAGSIVYFVTAVTPTGAGSSQTIAWTDVASDVTTTAGATSLKLHVAPALFISPPILELPTTIDSLFNVVPDYPSGLFLIYTSKDHSTYFPTATTTKPTATTTLVPYWNQALVTGADLAAASGSRLVAYNNDSQQPKFALVAMPGTPAVNVGSQITVPTPSSLQAAFASEPGGGVLWTSATLSAGAIGAARLTVLAATSATASLSGAALATVPAYVDIEHYAAPLTTTVVAPPTWVDGTTLALGLAADHTDLSKTAVHVVTVKGGAVTIGTDAGADYVSLPTAASAIDVRSSKQFAYALGEGSASSTVYVLAPLCP